METNKQNKQLEREDLGLDELELDQDVGTEQVDSTIIDKQDKISVEGSEHFGLKCNGIELTLGSSRIGVDVLCNVALAIYKELKQLNEDKGRGYVG